MSIHIPEKFLGRIGYQIMPERFCRSGPKPEPMEGRIIKSWDDFEPRWKPEADGEFRNRDFVGGDLKGITSKLDYIKNMGFDLIYLNPISFSDTYHHYDILDQTVIDPYIGDWQDFEELCQEAHKKDILIVVDLVFNHKSIMSESVQNALKGDQKARKLFEYNESTGKLNHWNVFDDLIQCNKLDPDFQEEACRIGELYVRKGADGIRLDLGENFPKKFTDVFSARVKALNSEILIVNERWKYATDNGRYIDNADTVMNYPATDAIMRWVRWRNFQHLLYTFQRIAEYPEQVQNVLWNHMDSHDTPRALTMLVGVGMSEDPIHGDQIWDIEWPWRRENSFLTYEFRKWEYEEGPNIPDIKVTRKKLNVALFICYNLRGIPFIFSGTELGVYGYKDPFNRIPYPWHIANQIARGVKNEVFTNIVDLGQYKKSNNDILATGSMQMEASSDIAKIVRSNNQGTIIAFANRSDNVQKLGNLFQNATVVFNSGNNTSTELKPYGCIALRI